MLVKDDIFNFHLFLDKNKNLINFKYFPVFLKKKQGTLNFLSMLGDLPVLHLFPSSLKVSALYVLEHNQKPTRFSKATKTSQTSENGVKMRSSIFRTPKEKYVNRASEHAQISYSAMQYFGEIPYNNEMTLLP